MCHCSVLGENKCFSFKNCLLNRGDKSFKYGGFPGGSDDEESACNARDQGSVPGSGRFPGEGNGNPLWYSRLENSMDREAWQATVHRITELDTTEQLMLAPEHQRPNSQHVVPFFFFPFIVVVWKYSLMLNGAKNGQMVHGKKWLEHLFIFYLN